MNLPIEEIPTTLKVYRVQEKSDPPLSMDSIVNDEVLFVSFSKTEWLPIWLNLDDYIVYEIEFKLTGAALISEDLDNYFESKYFDLFYTSGNNMRCKFTDLCKETHDKLGINFFYLKSLREPSEGIIYNAKDYVTNVRICDTKEYQ